MAPLKDWAVYTDAGVFYLAKPGSRLFPGEEDTDFIPLDLEYMTGNELERVLPPRWTGQFTTTPYARRCLFSGSMDEFKAFEMFVRAVDLPRTQLRFDILILDSSDSTDLQLDSNFSITSRPDFNRAALLSDIGKALSLNFDLLSSFGYQFVMRMEAALRDSRARVIADTILRGLAGDTLSFFNTTTSRFRPAAQTEYPGTTFDTGISIDIIGRVEGDGVILMDVSAALSSREEAFSGDALELPRSSEKGVHTVIRGRSGEPLVIGGFKKQEKRTGRTGVPFLRRIPLIGQLFSEYRAVEGATEMLIYIVPHIESELRPNEGKYFWELLKKYGELF